MIFGEYIVSCLHSKNRALREAALAKINLDLNNGVYDRMIRLRNANNPDEEDEGPKLDIRDMLWGLSMIIKKAAQDKISNVFLLGMNLAQTLCELKDIIIVYY
jgi:hypothetical protein